MSEVTSRPTNRSPETHHLKTAPVPWMHVRDGLKTAEFRRDDRGFEVGDTLRLYFVTLENQYVDRVVTEITRGPLFGIPEGYCMMSLSQMCKWCGSEPVSHMHPIGGGSKVLRSGTAFQCEECCKL